MKITVRQAEFFVAVGRLLHFGRAAEELFVSQSVVSQEIRRLEKNLGVTLFDRSTRNVVLTPAGADLLPAAIDLCAAATRLADRAELLTDSRSALVRLAATPSAMDRIVPLVLRQAEETFPRLTVEDVAVETGEVADALHRGGYDVGIGRYVNAGPGYRSEVIATEPLFVALSSGHPLAGSEAIDLSRLADLPLLLWPRERNPEYYDRLMEICASAGLEPLVLVSRPRIIGTRSYLLSDGRAFALIPRSTADTLAQGIVAVPLATPAMLPLSVVWLRDDPRQEVHAFVELIRQLARRDAAAEAS